MKIILRGLEFILQGKAVGREKGEKKRGEKKVTVLITKSFIKERILNFSLFL